MAKEALELWRSLPVGTRRKLLSNAWCGNCRKAVTIVDYHAELKGALVLEGFCGSCGHKVARVIDGLPPASEKKTKTAAAGVYIFDVRLYGRPYFKEKKKIMRKIQIPGSKSLYDFARVIVNAFGFQFDHCFGFYDDLKNMRNCRKIFELFVDVGENSEPQAKGVKKTRISQAFDAVGEKLDMLFDYGDDWQFTVELKEIRKADKGNEKPVVLERIGKAPQQYPPCDD